MLEISARQAKQLYPKKQQWNIHLKHHEHEKKTKRLKKGSFNHQYLLKKASVVWKA